MARVNYQREKRLKDLDRQRKQEEKRTRKLQKDLDPNLPAETGDAQETGEAPETPEGPEA